MTLNDIKDMALVVAQAIYKATGSQTSWEDLEESEQADFLICAHAAMGAHDAFLSIKGYQVVRIERGPRSKLAKPAPKRLLGADGKPVN